MELSLFISDKSLKPPPGAGMYLKFDIVREYISKNYPEIMDEYDSEGDDGDVDDVVNESRLRQPTPGFDRNEFRTEEVDDIDDDHEGDIDSSESSSSE